MSVSFRTLVSIVLLASPAVAELTVAGDSGSRAPEGFGVCFKNHVGLGMCGDGFTPCKGLQECDPATPCADGKFCAYETNCLTTLPGVCVDAFADGGCSNPGSSKTGHPPCLAAVFFEDFVPVLSGPEGPPPPSPLHKMTTTLDCGSGASLFAEQTCPANIGAPTPLDTGRWGVAGNCATFATTGHRLHATTGSIDVSSCARTVLDFDYLIDTHEGAAFDRVFVTVSIDGGFPEVIATNQIGAGMAFTDSAPSCAGTLLPVGTMVEDGAWHHFRAGVGDGNSVEVTFWGETYDGIANDGPGWFFDDLRIDCGELIFGDGFEGANFLRWSGDTAPPLLVGFQEVFPGSCKDYFVCGGPESTCMNVQTVEGPAYCVNHPDCSTSCTFSEECGAGNRCLVNTCCGPGGWCAPAACDPDAPPWNVGPERMTTTGG